jgi:hypothetical protein
VSNLYRRSGLSRVEACSLLLSSPAPSLFHRCSLSFAVVIQFGDPSIVLTGKLKKKKKKEKKLPACRGEGSAAGPLLAARALSLRCAASTVLTWVCALLSCQYGNLGC